MAANKTATKKTTAAPKKAAAKPASNGAVLFLVVALMAVEHDGQRYEEGEEFELSPKAANALADVNAVKVLRESVAAETSDAGDEGEGSEGSAESGNNSVNGEGDSTAANTSTADTQA